MHLIAVRRPERIDWEGLQAVVGLEGIPDVQTAREFSVVAGIIECHVAANEYLRMHLVFHRRTDVVP